MSPRQWVRCLATIVFAAVMLGEGGDASRADAWQAWGDCGCSQPSSISSGAAFSSCLTHPDRLRPTPRYKSYNSSWARVPVTNYRPQVFNDPSSGVSVTTLQPCNTYEWQHRRTAGCSLWQRLVSWWRSHCCRCGASTMPSATICSPTNDWVVSSPQPAATPYYAPSTNGRLVPVPSGVSPSSPAPADHRPQLDPLPPRSSGDSSAVRPSAPESEVFVRTLGASETLLELHPPLVAPGAPETSAEVYEGPQPVPPFTAQPKAPAALHAEVHEGPQPVPRLLDASSDDQAAAVGGATLDLVPVSWSTPTAPHDRQLPTDEIWDDTGWRSEQ
ncbi:MAG: hypothetical protein WD070_04180 [Pirellulaceae bacterium]